MPLKGFEVKTSVICEEVRQESNGKFIIIGAMVNGPNISDDDKTKVRRLALYLEIQMPMERTDLKVQLKNKDQKDPVLHADIDAGDLYEDAPDPEKWVRNPIVVIAIGREDFYMSGSGDYHLQYSTEDGKWTDYKEIYFPPENVEAT